MAAITRIIIKSESGWGSIDDAYKDKLTIEANSIRYERKPEIKSDYNAYQKWSYRTNAPEFRELFEKLTAAVTSILKWDDELSVTDVGPITFTAVFADKERLSRTFFLPSKDFRRCFNIIRLMVPSLEQTPDVLG